jgi:hypothetical protein
MAQSTGADVLAIMPGVINRADNKSLRFAMLKYGLESFCQEMLKHGAPLKLADDQPSVGRFYPQLGVRLDEHHAAHRLRRHRNRRIRPRFLAR